MSLHIGEIIQRKIKERRATLKEFAQYMDMSYRNAQDFVKRDIITTAQLKKASEFLNDDLTIYFRPEAMYLSFGESEITYSVEQQPIKICLFVSAKLENMNRFHDLLKDVNGLAAAYGFTVGV